ncbi:MAG: hypothetical protein Q8K70_05830 [Bacteroidota bacterium]|nr:hypothetical protein [Bacteroidota bacterium]
MRYLILLFFAIIIGSCSSKKKKALSFEPKYMPGANAIIYKTKANYNNLVAVTLSDDKSEIISYPHPTDVFKDSLVAVPTVLNKGYLLDNRGINTHVAFLKITYKEYAQLSELPSLKVMYDMIIDKDPISEMCNCGHKESIENIVEKINYLIDKNKLEEVCKKLK